MLLQKPRAYAEVYNDLDDDIANFFRVLRDPGQSERLIQLLHLTPYARAEFDLSYQDCDEPVERARRTAVRACMGFGSAGATKGVTGFRIDTARPYGTAQHLWSRYPGQLPPIIERLQGVLIENRLPSRSCSSTTPPIRCTSWTRPMSSARARCAMWPRAATGTR